MPKITVRVTSKGQITLPKEVREQLSIKKGDLLFVESVAANRVILGVRKLGLLKNKPEKNVILRTAGLWKDRDIDGYVEELRKASGRRLFEHEGPG